MSDWQSDLEELFTKVDAQHADEDDPRPRPEVTVLFKEVVLPAFRELRGVLAEHGRTTVISSYTEDAEHAVATIIVSKGRARKIEYSIRVDVHPGEVIPYAETRAGTRMGKAYVSKSTIRSGLQHFSMQNLTKDDVQHSFVPHYTPMLWHQLDDAP